MAPISVGTSHFTLALETGQAKLWMLLVGVNEYQDPTLSNLRYSALDCQGLGKALQEATQTFPEKEIIVHHDFVGGKPTLATVKASLEAIEASAKAQDTVLFYFSGHGLLELSSQQTVLCLADTVQQNLLQTGLRLNELLTRFNNCAAHSQLIWLDACHCGNMTLSGARGASDPTAQLLDALRHKAANSKGFYALLSCDRGQQSWEFSNLGHGVFSYYLMRGLRGEAANPAGVIDADGLYRYVYQQTLQYIEQANQQLQLINQQKRHRGDPNLYPAYSPQTPKRIVEGVGELILGLKLTDFPETQQRQALIVDSLSESQTHLALDEVLQKEGNFQVQSLAIVGQQESEIRASIQDFFQSNGTTTKSSTQTTLLLYLRGRMDINSWGESRLILNGGVEISCPGLRQILSLSNSAQQIVILDCHGSGSIAPWIETLKMSPEQSQCLLGTVVADEDRELFSQVLLESLVAINSQAGLSVVEWLTKLKSNCEQLGMTLLTWLWGTQGVIELWPGKKAESLPTNKAIGQSIISSSPLLPTVPEPPQNQLLPEQYLELEAILVELIGPVAPMLLRQLAQESQHPTSLLAGLQEYLIPSQRLELEPKLRQLLSKNNAQFPPKVNQLPTESKTLDETFIYQCEQELIQLIGPIGRFITTTILQGQPQISIADFVETVAAEIPNSQQAFAFRQRWKSQTGQSNRAGKLY